MIVVVAGLTLEIVATLFPKLGLTADVRQNMAAIVAAYVIGQGVADGLSGGKTSRTNDLM